jgi:hypothetical protein
MKKVVSVLLFICFFNTISLSAWEMNDWVSSSYKHKNWIRGGYSEKKLSNDMYQVLYEGNSYTSSSKAVRFAFIRASELTLKEEKKYFILIDKQENHSNGRQLSMEVWNHIQNDSIFSNIVNNAIDNYIYVFDSDSPKYSIMIKMFDEKPHQENCLDAEAIIQENIQLLKDR